MYIKQLLVLAGAALGCSALAIDFFELEPNDNKAQANLVSGMAHGDRIIGNSISSTGTGIDTFRVSTAGAALGIYRHRLVLTTSGTAGHIGSIRGTTQTAAPPDTMAGIPWDGVVGSATTTDTAVQTSSTTTTPARFNQWYGFGTGGEIYYRVTGGAATTADYEATLETTQVTPIDIGTYNEGLVTMDWFNQGHTSDTDMWVYDAGFNAIAGYGNDDNRILGVAPRSRCRLNQLACQELRVRTVLRCR